MTLFSLTKSVLRVSFPVAVDREPYKLPELRMGEPLPFPFEEDVSALPAYAPLHWGRHPEPAADTDPGSAPTIATATCCKVYFVTDP